MIKRLQAAFNIHEGEGRMVALVLAYAMLLYFSNMMARTASMALFFGEYDAETLPYTYLVLMIIGPLVSLIYLRLNNNLSLSKVLLGVHGFLLVTLLIIPVLLNRSSSPFLLFALPIYFGVNNSLTISSFWNLLGRIYNIRQGKRLFGLLSSGEHMTTIIAGALAPLFVARAGTISLYWIGALFMVLTMILLVIINRNNAEKMETVVSGQTSRGRQTGMADLVKEPYVRLIFGLFTLFIIGAYMVGNINYAQAEIRFPTAEDMASYIGIFMAIFGALSLIVQWFIAGRVMDRFGVRSMLLATPTGLFIFMALFAVVGTFNETAAALFWLAAAAAMWQAILDAVDSAAINILYQPLPAHLRTQAQTTVIGVVYPVAIGLAGAVLIVLLHVLNFDTVRLSYATLIVIAFWLAIAVRLGRAYPVRLRQALQDRILGGVSLPHPDRASVSVFEDALQSNRPAAVLYALNMLSEIAPERLAEQLPQLLAYPNDEVQIATLRYVAAQPWEETPAGVLTLLQEQSHAKVRAEALRAWFTINPDDASSALVKLAEDEEPAVQIAALSLMRLHDDPQLRQAGIEQMRALADSPEPQQRVALAVVIGATAVPSQAPLLIDLLYDSDEKVRQSALEAAALARFPDSWPAITPSLAHLSTRDRAIIALAAGGEAVMPVLLEASQDTLDQGVLGGLLTVCGRIGGEQATAILKAQLDNSDAEVRHETYLALARCGYEASGTERERVLQQLLNEASAATVVLEAMIDTANNQYTLLVADALDQRRKLLTDNMLLLLSYLYEQQTVMSARDALAATPGDEERRAYAIESLDILLSHEEKELLFPFFQDAEASERLAGTRKAHQRGLLGLEDRLLALTADKTDDKDRWTQLSAIYGLGRLGDQAARAAIVQAAVQCADDPLLVETALFSLEQLQMPLQALADEEPLLGEAIAGWRERDTQKSTRLQRMETLKQVDIFSHLPNEILLAIAGLLEDIYVAPGQELFHLGEPGEHLFVVVEGHLRVHDRDLTHDTLGSGDVVGEMALLDNEPRSASVTAVTDSHLLRLDQGPFYELLATQPALSRELMALLSARLRAKTEDVTEAEIQQDEAVRQVLPLVGSQPGMKGVAAQGQLAELQKVVILKGVDLFGASDDQLLGQLAQLLDVVDLSGGERLFSAGDPGKSMYVVGVGQVSVHVGPHVLANLGEGEVFGEMALLESKPRTASVTAVVPTQLLRLEQQPFFELLEIKPELALGIIQMLSRRLRLRLVAASDKKSSV